MPSNMMGRSFDGSPGDLTEGEDITGTPLRPLSEGPAMPRSEFSNGSPIAMGARGEPDALTEEREPVIEEAREPRRNLRDRIAQLVGQRNEYQGRSESYERELDDLRSQLQRTNALLLDVSRGARAAPDASPAQDIYGQPDPKRAQAGAPPHFDAVLQEVRALRQELNQSREVGRRERLQQESLARAWRDMPELSKPGSQAQQIFSELWNQYYQAQHQIVQLPDAPEHVALQVRGLLADELPAERQTTARKRSAQIHTPSPQPTELIGGSQSLTSRKVIDEGLRRMRTGIGTQDDYIATRRALRDAGRTTPR